MDQFLYTFCLPFLEGHKHLYQRDVIRKRFTVAKSTLSSPRVSSPSKASSCNEGFFESPSRGTVVVSKRASISICFGREAKDISQLVVNDNAHLEVMLENGKNTDQEIKVLCRLRDIVPRTFRRRVILEYGSISTSKVKNAKAPTGTQTARGLSYVMVVMVVMVVNERFKLRLCAYILE